MRTGVDLFCGAAGGWTLGMAWAGVVTVAACEAVESRAETYSEQWDVPVYPDVKRLKGEMLPPNLWAVYGSPPCKGISEVNHKGKGVDDDGLFFEAIRIAAECRPFRLLLENVDRLRTRGLDRVLLGLEEIGYAGRTLRLGSHTAGKDHGRERIFIVATDTARREGWPPRQPRPTPAGPAPQRRDFGGPVDCREGLGHLGPEAIGRHLRAYDGVSDRVAERARHAYGDALDPTLPYVIAKALIAWEAGVGA